MENGVFQLGVESKLNFFFLKWCCGNEERCNLAVIGVVDLLNVYDHETWCTDINKGKNRKEDVLK